MKGKGFGVGRNGVGANAVNFHDKPLLFTHMQYLRNECLLSSFDLTGMVPYSENYLYTENTTGKGHRKMEQNKF